MSENYVLFLLEMEAVEATEALNGNFEPDDAYTPEQREKIDQLRERVRDILLKPEHVEDTYLSRWLVARGFDLDKAEEMLKKHIKFMKVNGLDKISEDSELPEAADYFYTAMLGYDKEGSVVRILNVGASDIRGLCYSLSKIDSLKVACHHLESDATKQQRERQNDTICDKHVYILDLAGLSWRAIVQRIVVDRAFMLLRSYEANYPEKLKVAYVVNAPGFFSFIYNWLKNVLPESILSKLEIVSSQEELVMKLSKILDLSIVPAHIGGSRRDPDGDPNCNTLYKKPLGTPLPEKLIPTDHLETLKNDPECRKVIVEYKSCFVAEKLVTEPMTVLQWDFQTLDYDIRFGLRYKKDEFSESEEIIPPHRVESHLIPESGNFQCEKTGIYELVFDNTYSWMTSKEVYFKVNIVPPKQN